MYGWLAQHDEYYGARFRRIFDIYWENFALPFEQIWTTEDRLGAALWSPPNCWKLGLVEELLFLPDWIAVTGLKNLYSRWRAIEKVQAKHPHIPHWYLMAVGVAPEVQGQGYCSKLLKPVLDICDRTQTPAYLENSNHKSNSASLMPSSRQDSDNHFFLIIVEVAIGSANDAADTNHQASSIAIVFEFGDDF
jgi:RimJ/RimL family protein N-acetyltransferase